MKNKTWQLAMCLLLFCPLLAHASYADNATPRSNYGDYRKVASLHGLTNEQVEKINKAFDESLQKHQAGMAIDEARHQYFESVKKFLNSDQLKELASFRDPQEDISGLKIDHDLPYVSPPDFARVGDLYLPSEIKAPVPAVMFIHGGGWSGGTKEQAAHTAIALAKHGFAVFNINYRLVGKGGEFPADVIDVKDAFAYLASKSAEWKIDPSRIAVMGGSAGAHLAMMIGYTSNKQFSPQHFPKSRAHPVAVVSWFGPVDLDNPHEFVQHYLAKAGTNGAHDASPISYADTGIPTLFVHGTDDQLVKINASEQMNKALQERKIDSEFVPIKGAQHGFKGAEWNTAIDKTIEFLDRQFAKKANSQ